MFPKQGISVGLGESEFLNLVQQYQATIYQHAVYLLGNPDDAKDVAQDTFIKAWQHIGTLHTDTIQSWLIKCANNLCIDLLRRRRFQTPLTKGDGAEIEMLLYQDIDGKSYQQAAPSPEQLCLKQERQHLVQEAIAKLPLHLRTTLVMREIDGLSFDEIAETLHQPVGTVKSNVFRARSKLRETLRKLMER